MDNRFITSVHNADPVIQSQSILVCTGLVYIDNRLRHTRKGRMMYIRGFTGVYRTRCSNCFLSGLVVTINRFQNNFSPDLFAKILFKVKLQNIFLPLHLTSGCPLHVLISSSHSCLSQVIIPPGATCSWTPSLLCLHQSSTIIFLHSGVDSWSQRWTTKQGVDCKVINWASTRLLQVKVRWNSNLCLHPRGRKRRRGCSRWWTTWHVEAQVSAGHSCRLQRCRELDCW